VKVRPNYWRDGSDVRMVLAFRYFSFSGFFVVGCLMLWLFCQGVAQGCRGGRKGFSRTKTFKRRERASSRVWLEKHLGKVRAVCNCGKRGFAHPFLLCQEKLTMTRGDKWTFTGALIILAVVCSFRFVVGSSPSGTLEPRSVE